ncbi:MAG: radical SAM protein [Deltaproteobacteria bacterium]|nr:radical SAM protein [Deltaproteobacteria bacterium]
MRVLLVGPDLEANVSLGYLAASLQQAGHEALQAAFNGPADAARVLGLARGADLVGLSLSFQVRAPQFFALAEALKAEDPARPVIAGGHFATCAAEAILRDVPALDLILLHEAEDSLVELAGLGAGLLRRAPEVPGLVHREGEHLRRSAPRPVRRELESLPFPDRAGPARLLAGVPTAYLMGARGCVRACDYCCIATLHRQVEGPRFRRREPEDIAREMAFLHARGVRQFVFHDDNFLVPNPKNNRERLGRLADAIDGHGLEGIGIVMKAGPRDVDRPALEQLLEMGLLRIFLGIESSSQRGMDSIGRRQTPEEAEGAVALCEALELSSQYTMIIFHPDATIESMLSDLAFVERHPAHPLNYCRAELYAGTPLEARMIAEGRAQGSYLARTYRYADPRVARVWEKGKDLFAGRCWGKDDLLGQVIRLDHQAAVLRHFYGGRKARRTAGDFARFEIDLNLETAAYFRELVLLCGEAPSDDDPALARGLAELSRRELSSRRVQLERLCELRARIDGLTSPVIDLAVGEALPPEGLASRLARLPRHAAAVLVAAGLASATACSGRSKVDHGVAEAAPPPYDEVYDGPPPAPQDPPPQAHEDTSVIHDGNAYGPPSDAEARSAGASTPALAPAPARPAKQKERVRRVDGVAEAAPPPFDEIEVLRRQDGVAEAAPPPFDDELIRLQDGVAEAAPPPFDPPPPPPPPPERLGTGQLYLSTRPEVDISVDGVERGRTPVYLEDLKVGEHTVRLHDEAAGIDETRTIRIARDQRTTLKLELEAPKKKRRKKKD